MPKPLKSIRVRSPIGSNYSSIRWQIVSIVLIAAVSFAIFIGFALSQSRSQSLLIENIQNVRYPAQTQLQDASYKLRLLQIEIEEAVDSSNLDLLDNTQRSASDFRRVMRSIADKSQRYNDMAEDILMKFNAYYESSFLLSSQVIKGQLALDDAHFMRKINVDHRLKQLDETLDRYEVVEFDNLTQAIERVSKNARQNTLMAALVGVSMTILTVAMAYAFGRRVMSRINHIVDILKHMASDEDDLSVRIRENGRDEVAQMTHWFNEFMRKLERRSEKNTRHIKRLAYTDTLTKLPNRRLLHDQLEKDIIRSRRNGDGLAVLFLDLDNFKLVNDQLGHDAGDQLVKGIAARLGAVLRESDLTVTPEAHLDGSMVARMGGDEFIIIVRGLPHLDDVAAVAERVRKSVLEPMEIDGKTVGVGVSIGISTYPSDALTAEELISNADIAMYEAKNAGKNSYRFFDAKMQADSARKSLIASELTRLLSSEQPKELELFYQPKYDIDNQQVIGAEALLRWQSPVLGTVTPIEIIEVAEASQLIYQVDYWVIRTVCQQIQHWQREHLSLVPIAINISAKNASNPHLVGLVKDTLNHYQLRASDIEIEVTETSALDNIEQVAQNINELMAFGIRVAVDDFGAGNASLTLFRYCRVDTLKIDQLFVANVESTYNSRMLKGIVSLGHDLGATLVAEGVETQTQVSMLKSIGCFIIQGYKISRPLPVASFERYLKDNAQ